MEQTNFLLEIKQSEENKNGFDVKVRIEGSKFNLMKTLMRVYDEEPLLKKILKDSLEVHDISAIIEAKTK